ncbi:MAG TPA: hypothetical protein VGF92_02350 [Stellaceae bacterium]|jgi:hypothetical protein
MSETSSIPSGTKVGSDAAALSLIDIRRIDRAAGKSGKRGDLTNKLKRRAKGESPPSAPAIVAPEVAPVAAPSAPAIVARETAPVVVPSAPAIVAPAAPVVASPVAPEPSLPPLVAFAPEITPPPTVRRVVPLPEPYFAPEPPPEPEAKSPLPAATEAPRAAPLAYDDLRGIDDLIYYWDELRAGRDLPLFANLDRTRIAISWPDTVMVNYEADRAAVPQMARLSRLTGVVEFNSMVTDWILSCSRQVARVGKAMEIKGDFVGANSPRSYHMLLLPFANPGGASDHVLCHLSSAD